MRTTSVIRSVPFLSGRGRSPHGGCAGDRRGRDAEDRNQRQMPARRSAPAPRQRTEATRSLRRRAGTRTSSRLAGFRVRQRQELEFPDRSRWRSRRRSADRMVQRSRSPIIRSSRRSTLPLGRVSAKPMAGEGRWLLSGDRVVARSAPPSSASCTRDQDATGLRWVGLGQQERQPPGQFEQLEMGVGRSDLDRTAVGVRWRPQTCAAWHRRRVRPRQRP